MLTGKELGQAIRQAVELKDAAERKAGRPGVRLVDVAAHFSVKPPSVQDWINKGTISKDKLPQLWLYFSDVVGPEHWGLASFPQARVPGAVFDEITDDERQLLDNFRLLTEAEQVAYANEIAQRAATLRAYLDRQLRRFQPNRSVIQKDVAPSAPVMSTDEQAQSRPADLYGIEGPPSGNKNASSAEHLGGAHKQDRRRA